MLMAIGYYRYGGWRRAHMLQPAAAEQAPTTGQGVPATAVMHATE
jgi:hypothetical protein